MSITSRAEERQSLGPTAGSSLRSLKKRRTREQIYDAALELFTDRPYDEVTVDEICARAEVGRATFFRFFGSKAGLLLEFNHRLADRVVERLRSDADAGSGSDATARLWIVQDELATSWGSSAPAMRQMAREWIHDATATELGQAGAPDLLEVVAAIVRDGQRAGEFTDGYQPEFVAWIILAALAAVTAGWLGSGDDDRLRHGTRDSVAFLLDGLRSPAQPSAPLRS